mmetsp:Transcript_160942/g.516554  ORF Transcript_160942/g.516554 Transcript_160942/m.516554 type:complete len:221 (+) Transcript_160942:6702-7364(+)
MRRLPSARRRCGTPCARRQRGSVRRRRKGERPRRGARRRRARARRRGRRRGGLRAARACGARRARRRRRRCQRVRRARRRARCRRRGGGRFFGGRTGHRGACQRRGAEGVRGGAPIRLARAQLLNPPGIVREARPPLHLPRLHAAAVHDMHTGHVQDHEARTQIRKRQRSCAASRSVMSDLNALLENSEIAVSLWVGAHLAETDVIESIGQQFVGPQAAR